MTDTRFQSFRAPSDPAAGSRRIRQLRAALSDLNIDAVLVPRSDAHQGEYVPANAERLSWLTGFTGSAGLAIIGRRAAALLVDGRYTLQAAQQVDAGSITVLPTPAHTPEAWIGDTLAAGATIGFDPWLHTVTAIERMTKALSAKGMKLKPMARNPVDRIWGKERPQPPLGPVTVHALEHAGQPADEKIATVQGILQRADQSAVVLTLPDSIAWLLNIRGSDIAHNPVALCFAVLPASGKPEVFLASEKLAPDVRGYLQRIVRLQPPDRLPDRVRELRAAKKPVRLDPDTAAWWFLRQLGKTGGIARAGDPCIPLKARKNATELDGARAAHRRDGAAMTRFLAWFDREAPRGKLDEITCVAMLERMRRETNALREISFDTISGSGPHGAIVHYRVDAASNRTLGKGELFLLDSGAQYADGTTDVTRTIAVGPPTAEMRSRFTLVLKGHIAIATAIVPVGTRGIEIDAFARRALWAAGLDFDHGTGHGVGSYLSVHEGPQSISRRGMAELHAGMIVSNEPGYYKTGAYGIRIENLLLVGEPTSIAGGDRPMMRFETLTLVPIDRRLIDLTLMTSDEIAWVDAYHARVLDEIGRDVRGADKDWLTAACRPLR
jgi:Xaa-Pro aminopeptidase